MPMIISTKEVLRNIYSNGHVLPKIKKGLFNKKSALPRKVPIALNIGPLSADPLSKTQQFKNQLCIIKEEDKAIKDLRGYKPNTSSINGHHKALKQFEAINSINI